MTDADLKALFAEDEPPPRDPVFSAAVMAEVARRRFIIDMALLTSVATAGGFLLWALWLPLQPVLAQLSAGLAPLGACLTLAAASVILLDGRVIPAVPRNHG
jgi:hypothetical protein